MNKRFFSHSRRLLGLLLIQRYIVAMHRDLSNTVLSTTTAQAIASSTVIQSLWSGYGEILRLELAGAVHPSVILKHIKPPKAAVHPRGWNTDISHDRKVRSYQVEACWYQNYAHRCDSSCPVPDCLAVKVDVDETILLLTDLDAAGFDTRKESVSIDDMHACLDWLASFHATFLGSSVEGLWECGSYWHLDTRPDELAALEDVRLRESASLIDGQLRSCRYQTLIHGDAKLANFCFTGDTSKPRVAAVDFQYVGRGCGMKDVAYFVGSCLREDDCEALEDALLDHYFCTLQEQLAQKKPGFDADDLEAEWRELYDVAWADFHRFLKGWSPGHWKINSYSEKLTRRVIERLQA
ncbi:oxidoreductase family protein [Congregibacter variabilis]|uniref:Oxidoreductase family protein n=1 Tax=Congregibacter variabilis TaxID=3081200 RepID=A0ABZ0I3M6_9GAMM|nr:oxidoreductase family protein [Congregibacter sp. IMCC43200]